MKCLATILLSIAVLAVCPNSHATTWHVPSKCLTIQAGIDSASYGDTVLVACGTYYERNIEPKSGVCLRSESGLAGCATIDAHTPEGNGRVLYCTWVDSTTIIEGFTLINGSAYEGGGVYCRRSSLRFQNCVFSDNSASTNSGRGGGGMFCEEACSPRITSCVFTGNSALQGGGACFIGGGPVLTDCVFSGNSAANAGGMMAEGTCLPILVRCVFIGNSAGTAGGFRCRNGCVATLLECTFSQNSASSVSYGGGAMICSSASCALSGCTLVSNQAHLGAGMIVAAGSAVLVSCTLAANSADETAGGLYCSEVANVTLESTIVASNTGGAGLATQEAIGLAP